MDQWVHHGVGPWFYVDRVQTDYFRHRGVDSDMEMSVAVANSGDIQIELIQQRNDSPSAYKEFLDAGREGMQHVAYWTTDFQALYDKAISLGYKVLQEGSIGGVHVDDLRVTAEPGACEHPLPHPRGIDAVSYGIDGPGHLIADDGGRFRYVGIEADPGEMVGEVDTCGAHRDAHLASRRRRIRPLLHLQDGQVTVLGDDDRAHEPPLSTRHSSGEEYPRRRAKEDGPPQPRNERGGLRLGHHFRVSDGKGLAVMLHSASACGREILQPLGLRRPVWQEHRQPVLGREHVQRCSILRAGLAADMRQHAVCGNHPAHSRTNLLVTNRFHRAYHCGN